MKEHVLRVAKQDIAFLVAVIGFLFGTFSFFLLQNNIPQGYIPPLTSALKNDAPFLSLVADYAEEVKLFLLPLLLAFLVKHPLPLLAGVWVRGFYLGISAACLFFLGDFLTAVLYLLIHTAALMAHACMMHCVLPHLKTPPRKLLQELFPFLFYAGVIFLLTLIRNLIYYLIF